MSPVPTPPPLRPTLPSHVLAADGLPLHLHAWPLTHDVPARGTVLIVHGLGEHAARHAATAARLNAAGWHVAGHDQRGHGRSGGARGDLPASPPVAHWLQDDLARVIDALTAGGWPRPLVLLGHSMGGLVAARFAAAGLPATHGGQLPDWYRPLDGLLLSAPALDAGISGFSRLLIGLGRRVAPHLAASNGLSPDDLCSNPAVVAAYRSDPLVHDRITPRLAMMFLRDGPLVLARAPDWQTPTLIAWSEADRCIATAGCARFAHSAPAACVTAQPHTGLGHELFNEPQGAAILADWTSWLARRF